MKPRLTQRRFPTRLLLAVLWLSGSVSAAPPVRAAEPILYSV